MKNGDWQMGDLKNSFWKMREKLPGWDQWSQGFFIAPCRVRRRDAPFCNLRVGEKLYFWAALRNLSCGPG